MSVKSIKLFTLTLLSSLILSSCISPSIGDSISSNSISDSIDSSSTSVEPELILADSELLLYLGTNYEISDLGNYLTIKNNNEDIVKFTNGNLEPISIGAGTIEIEYETYTRTITFYVVESSFNEDSFSLVNPQDSYLIGERINLEIQISTNYSFLIEAFTYEISSGSSYIKLDDNELFAANIGSGEVQANLLNKFTTNAVNIEISSGDRYETLTSEEFYADYYVATSNEDANLRTSHYLMSGDISEQVQEPTVEENRPTRDGKFIRNNSDLFSIDGNTYYVLNSEGEIAKEIYKDGAYVTVDDVAAYTYAFGDIPTNYISGKRGYPSSSGWGKYLRLNFSYYSGDVESYPYEPVMPDISGCGGNLDYYEIDIGTTGTDCDPAYTPAIYNDGNRITRGAARIVVTVYYNDTGEKITDLNDRYVFYTYNHYNDFQEYLNYENGWGEMFGNITGGGEISSRTNYNPTPYVEVVRENLLAA